MKNQNSAIANRKPEFLDIKNAKNPIYQPMAGKAVTNTENKDKGEDASQPPKSSATAIGADGQKTEVAGAVKAEAKVGKPALNLEGTLKLVEELHRRMVQRGRLVHTIDNLDKFEIEQKQEAEDTTSNYYQGCELEITDDKRNKFSTKNPVIIRAVALFVRNLCTNRLAEIELEITLPG